MNYWDAEELACAVLGLDYDEMVDDGQENEINEKLAEEFGIDIETFSDIAERLLEFTPTVSSGLSGKRYHAFLREVDGMGIAIVKKEA